MGFNLRRGKSKEQSAAKREGYAKGRTTIVRLVFPTGPPAIATILVWREMGPSPELR